MPVLAPGSWPAGLCPLFPHSRAESVWAGSLHTAPGLAPASARHQLVTVVTQTIPSYSHSMITTGIGRISSVYTDCCGCLWFYFIFIDLLWIWNSKSTIDQILNVFNHPLTIAKSLIWLARKLNLNEVDINWKRTGCKREAIVSACYLAQCSVLQNGQRQGPYWELGILLN